MVKSYLRHGPTESFGVVVSPGANSLYDGRKAYVPALEDVLVWDVKKGEQISMWHETGLSSLVTYIARSPVSWETFAVGYADGSIRLWSSTNQSNLVTFNGHKSAVSYLSWDLDGTRLASGSKDTEVIVWDVIGEVGLFRLRGHRDMITGLAFIRASEEPLPEAFEGSDSLPSLREPTTHLITSSKDTFIKLFSLSTQHCIETVVGHRSEAWSIAYDQKSGVLISGGGEGEVRCWKVDSEVLKNGVVPQTSTSNLKTPSSNGTKLKRAIVPIASLSLQSTSHTHNISQITLHPTLPVIAIHSGEKTVEVFRLRTEEELRRKLARRRRREREKQLKKGNKKGKTRVAESDEVMQGEASGTDEEDNGDGDEIQWRERLAIWSVIRSPSKIRSFSFAPETLKTKAKGGDLSIMLSLANNSLEVYHLSPPASSKSPAIEPERLYTLDLPGHRNDIRALSIASDDSLLASTSSGQLKIWNLKTTKCIRTMECDYAICCTFLPGDRHIVVGTKAGSLLLYDLSSSSLLEKFEDAHTGPVWSIDVKPDGRGVVSGSADKDIKFWDFEIKEVNNGDDSMPDKTSQDPSEESRLNAPPSGLGSKSKVLTMVHTKTLRMTDDILAVKYSPDGRLLAVSLLDSTVKVFFSDTLKFFLSLYGHKLPVLSLDISSDSKLIVTCSADKSIKIWGLDFGDCHRSLFAHEESIMQVAFEKGSHNFWSVSKDKMLKYWDGDKFECIQKLSGHAGEIWALAVSHRANFVVTGSHDKSIRVWEKTDEPLFLEEERERELEELFDSNLNSRDGKDELRVLPNGQSVPIEESAEVSKSTTETLMAGERIMEALQVSGDDKLLQEAHVQEIEGMSSEAASKVPPPPRNPLFQMYGGVGPEEYVLKVVRQIPAASLHDALLVLPFSRVMQLIEHLDFWAHKKWQITLTSRVLFFLLRTHHSQIVATRALRQTMISIRSHLREALKNQKDMVGYNLAALRYIQRQHEAARTAEFYEQDVMAMLDETKVKAKIEAGIKKRKRATLKS